MLGIILRVLSIKPNTSLANIISALILYTFLNKFFGRKNPHARKFFVIEPLRIENEKIIMSVFWKVDCGKQSGIAEYHIF